MEGKLSRTKFCFGPWSLFTVLKYLLFYRGCGVYPAYRVCCQINQSVTQSQCTVPLSHCFQLYFLGFTWDYAEWSPCSATCGHSGTRSRSLQCMNTERQKVNESQCRELQKPGIVYQPCNREDCPPR